jgi:nucleoid-associated protein EbfC
MGTGFSKKKKQAKMLQQKFTQYQSQIQNAEATGTAGNGLVTITLTGENELKQIKIKPECVDPEDVEGLEDLIKAAYADAVSKLKELSPEIPGGMPDLGAFGL